VEGSFQILVGYGHLASQFGRDYAKEDVGFFVPRSPALGQGKQDESIDADEICLAGYLVTTDKVVVVIGGKGDHTLHVMSWFVP